MSRIAPSANSVKSTPKHFYIFKILLYCVVNIHRIIVISCDSYNELFSIYVSKCKISQLYDFLKLTF